MITIDNQALTPYDVSFSRGPISTAWHYRVNGMAIYENVHGSALIDPA
jgi:hypothetical protein